MKNKKFFLIILALFNFSLPKDVDEEELLKFGNFSLPTSQQPGPLFGFGFGQTIVDKNDFITYLFYDFIKGRKKKLSEASPSLVYGISDTLSLFMQQSIAAKFEQNCRVSHGLEDLLIQLEQVIYYKPAKTSANLATVVGNITLPTGSNLKNPPTGFGAPSFYLGLTASHTNIDWYFFTILGGIFPISNKCRNPGNIFMYQFGVSKNLAYKTDEWILNLTLELDGEFKQKDKILKKNDCNSGGHQLFLGPSLFFSTQNFLFQAGISWFIHQRLSGKQNKDKYIIAFNFGMKY